MSTTATPKSGSKATAKKSLIVVLNLSPDILARFAPTAPSSVKSENSSSEQVAESGDKSSDSNSTPVPSNELAETNGTPTPKDGKRKRSGPPNPNARKRAPPMIDPNAPLREKGRPGPKKKPRLPDGSIDRNTTDTPEGVAAATTAAAAPAVQPATVAGHKLGPKANTGAINAGLRALDRSGKPCRRWEKKALQLKSFTGTVWGLSSWKAPTPVGSSGEDGLLNGSEGLPAGSSNVGSERSGPEPMMGIESSPAPRATSILAAA